jgi:hypothetical protein
MPVVPYYRGLPARVWTASMSGPVRAAAADPTAATSQVASTLPASPRPAAPPARGRAHEEAGAAAATPGSTGAWEAWASHWFTPDRR